MMEGDLSSAVHQILDEIKSRDQLHGRYIPADETELRDELLRTQAALQKVAKELSAEREAHLRTKELLRIALKPQAGGQKFVQREEDLSVSPAGKAQPPPFMAFAPQSSSAIASPKPTGGAVHTSHHQHQQQLLPSQKLQEMLSRAMRSTTPKRSTSRTMSPGSSRRAQQPNVVFGSASPRFQKMMLVGDHGIFTSSKSVTYDQMPHLPVSMVHPTSMAGTNGIGNEASKITLASPIPGTMELNTASPPSTLHGTGTTLRSPDVTTWVRKGHS